MLSIKNIISSEAKRTTGNFNKDLFKSDYEIIELADFNEDKLKSEAKIILSNDSILDRNSECIGQRTDLILWLNDDKKTLGLYKYSISQKINLHNEDGLQFTVYKQELTLKGFNWLVNTNNIDLTEPDTEKLLISIYEKEMRLNGIDSKLTYLDALQLAEIKPSGNRLLLLEDFHHRVKISFNKEGYLYEITKSSIEQKQKPKFIDLTIDEDNDTQGFQVVNEEKKEIKPKREIVFKNII